MPSPHCIKKDLHGWRHRLDFFDLATLTHALVRSIFGTPSYRIRNIFFKEIYCSSDIYMGEQYRGYGCSKD